MCEDLFEVYQSFINSPERKVLIASNMGIYEATLFVKAYMEDNYAMQDVCLTIQRMPLKGDEQ